MILPRTSDICSVRLGLTLKPVGQRTLGRDGDIKFAKGAESLWLEALGAGTHMLAQCRHSGHPLVPGRRLYAGIYWPLGQSSWL